MAHWSGIGIPKTNAIALEVSYTHTHDEARESPEMETERVYNFMTTFLMHRPEQELALVGHSGWLFTMCNAVMDCQGDTSLQSVFLTSEIRSMRVSFYTKEEDGADGVGDPDSVPQ